MPRIAAFRRRASGFALAAAFLSPLAGVLPAARAQGEPAPALEVIHLEENPRRLETIYRRIPTCTHGVEASQERDDYAAFARKSALGAVVAKIEAEDERVRLADGQPTPVAIRHLDLSGQGEFAEVHFFFTRLGLRNRLIDLESLKVTAEAGGTVRFEARLGLPCYEEVEEPAKPPAPGSNLVTEAETRQRLTYEKLMEVTTRSNPARVLEALASFDRRTESRALALTNFTVGKEIELHGVIVASPARATVKSDLEAAGFSVASESLQPAGICQKLAIRAAIEPRESTHESEELVEVVSGNGLFDARAEEVCASDMGKSLGRVTAKGNAPAASALTLHLRDVDLPDVFLILHDLTGESFLVDSDVKGKVDVEVETATLEQTLKALGSAGVTVSSSHLHRVSKTAKPAEKKSSKVYRGDAIDMSLQNADLVPTLCVIASVSRQPISFPPDLSGRVDVFASNLPVDELLDAVVTAAGFSSVVEKGGTFVGPEALVKAPASRGKMVGCNADDEERVPTEGQSSRLQEKLAARPSLSALRAADLELAALARKGDLWMAHVYAPPSRYLTLIDASQQLFEGNVVAVGPEGVTITGKSGALTTLKLKP